LEKLRIFSDDLEIQEDQDMDFDIDLFKILISLLNDMENVFVKFCIFEIFNNLSVKSKNFCEMFLDVEYFSIVYKFLDFQDYRFILKGINLIGNIIIYCDKAFDYLIPYFPLEIKTKELLLNCYSNKEILANILWLLRSILKRTNADSYENVCK